MKIVLAGGSGQVGTLLARHFCDQGHAVVELGRNPRAMPWRTVAWDAHSDGDWWREIADSEVVIGLAGRSVDCRYTAKNRRLIADSRVNSTLALARAIAGVQRPPRVWLQASTATIYAHSLDRANDEATGILGGAEPGVPDTWRFSIEVAKAWEAAARSVPLPRTRLVLLRSAMTMHPDPGSIFDVLLRLVRFGLGGTPGNGKQFVSWIHGRDFVRAIEWLIAHEALVGAVNLAAPAPLQFREFLQQLRRAWGARIGLPAPRWLLEMGAFVMRTETELILKSRRVVPGRLLASGFEFEFPVWSAAAAELCDRWRRAQRR